MELITGFSLRMCLKCTMKKMSNNPLIGGLTRMQAAQKERIARRLKALDAKWLPADQSFYKVEWLGELYEFTSVRELEDWIRSTAKDNNQIGRASCRERV